MRAHLLYYDMPADAKIANPSQFLWRLGVRVNLSVWIVPDANVPRVPVSEWRSRGAKVELVRFDENDTATIMRLAREALQSATEETLGGLSAAHDKLKAMYESVATGDDAHRKVVDAKAARYLRQARTFLVSVQECAATFMLTGDVAPLFDGLRNSIKAHDALFYAMRQKASGSATTKAPLEQLSFSFISHDGGNNA